MQLFSHSQLMGARAGGRLAATTGSSPRLAHVCRVAKPSAGEAATIAPRPEVPAASEVKAGGSLYKNVGPEQKTFGVAEGQLGNVATAALPALFRLGAGALCQGYNAALVPDEPGKYSVFRSNGQMLKETSKVASFPRPAQPLEIYEFEGCPFCKKVREAVNILDLDVIFRPTPQKGDVWRVKAIEMGGKKQFPLLVDPNADKMMYESDDIIRYLFTTYGDGEIPGALTAGFLTTLSAGLGNLGRVGTGSLKPSKQPEQPLILWGYEASPFSKIVREELCSMQLPYLHKAVARGSPKRQEVQDKYGKFQAPLLEDPNTECYLFESAAIITYLQGTYGVPAEDAPAAVSAPADSSAQ